MNWSQTKNLPTPEWVNICVIFERHFVPSRYHYFASRVLLSVFGRWLLCFYFLNCTVSVIYLLVGDSYKRLISCLDLKKYHGHGTNRSCHLDVYPTSGRISGLDAQSLPCLKRTAVNYILSFSLVGLGTIRLLVQVHSIGYSFTLAHKGYDNPNYHNKPQMGNKAGVWMTSCPEAMVRRMWKYWKRGDVEKLS